MALSRSKKILVIGGIVVLLGGITAASVLSRNRNAVPVQFDTVKRFEILESKVSASGEIRPKELYNLTAEVSGRVTSIKVTEGQLVKKDQPLIEVDPTQQATAKASAEANYQAAIQEKLQVQQQLFSAENNVNQTKNLLAGAQADLRRARATQDLNQKELNNLSKLIESGIVSKIEIDRASANLETAKAGVEAQEEQVKRLQTQVKDAEISVDRMKAALAGSEQREKSSKANLDSANDILNKTIKLAPIDGVVASLPVRVGEFALANLSSTPLMTIADMSEIFVEVKVDETDIANVKAQPQQSAKVKVDALNNIEIDGFVVEVGQSAITRTGQTIASNVTSQEAKDFKVKIKLNPSPEVRDRLRPGMSATAVITTTTRQNVVAIPLQALVSRDKNDDGKGTTPTPEADKPAGPVKTKREEIPGVYIDDNGKAKFVAVKTGITGETDIEITEGLKEGQRIVIGPNRQLRTLKDGTQIVKEETKPENTEKK